MADGWIGGAERRRRGGGEGRMGRWGKGRATAGNSGQKGAKMPALHGVAPLAPSRLWHLRHLRGRVGDGLGQRWAKRARRQISLRRGITASHALGRRKRGNMGEWKKKNALKSLRQFDDFALFIKPSQFFFPFARLSNRKYR